MKLSFEAKYVELGDDIDGDILEVTFDTLAPNQDEMESMLETRFVITQ